ncbi:MAG: sensor histidine kinase [Bauldia sp.]
MEPGPQLDGDRGRSQRTALGYAIAIGGVAVAFGLILLLSDVFAPRPRFLLLLPPLAGAVLVGGRGPGLVATALSLAAAAAIVRDIGIGLDDAAVEIAALAGLGLGAVWFAGRAEVLRRHAQERSDDLSAERAFLQSVLDTVPDAIMVIDDYGILRSFSPAAERLFGYSAAEAVGQNVKILMPSPHQENHDSYLAKYRATGQRHIIGIGRVVAGRRRNGSTFPLELSVGEINAPTGRFFTGFIRDLTERQAAEARLQELQSELTHISRLSAMGEMASTLAHELNQPLSALANYLRGARRLLDRPEGDLAMVTGALDKAAEQALRAGDIIRRLRDFVARGEEARTIEAVTRLVEEASALALVGAKEQGIRVSFRLDPRAPTALVDRVQVQQVLVNLIRNAVDAMAGAKKRELVIATRPVEGDMVEIAVSDTGPGIDPAIAGNLFHPFQTTKAQGMGLGLSICRTIIEAHGGRIGVDPPSGSGATFRFTVPSSAVGGDDRQ